MLISRQDVTLGSRQELGEPRNVNCAGPGIVRIERDDDSERRRAIEMPIDPEEMRVAVDGLGSTADPAAMDP
jgi:hypothetical protein